MCKHVCLFLKFYYEHPSKRIYINQMKGCIALWGEITQSLNHNQLLGTSASRKIIHCSRPIHGFWLLVELVLKEILYNGYCLQFESFAIRYINGSIFYSAIPISTVALYHIHVYFMIVNFTDVLYVQKVDNCRKCPLYNICKLVTRKCAEVGPFNTRITVIGRSAC